MEKLGVVSTVKSKRDARLAIAALTAAGREVLSDASTVVDDTMREILKRAPAASARADDLIAVFDDIGR
jgi:DNA-binding MarR family transcriptional regulator